MNGAGCRTVGIEAAMQNSGLGAALAAKNHPAVRVRECAVVADGRPSPDYAA